MPENTSGAGAPFSLNANLHEYAFARAIERYNVMVRNGRVPGGDYITVRKGRELHARWLESVAASGATTDTLVPSASVSTMNEVFDAAGYPAAKLSVRAQRDGTSVVRDPDAFYYVDDIMPDWSAVTGVRFGRNERQMREDYGVTFNDGAMLPCSPFDERFALRDTMLSNGSAILYAVPGDLVQDQVDPATGKHSLAYVDMSLDQQRRLNERSDGNAMAFYKLVYETEPNGSGRRRNADPDVYTQYISDYRPVAGPMSTIADVAGLTRIREFMSDKEYKAACRHMRGVKDEFLMTPAMSDLSVSILEYLRDNGIPFSIKPDRRAGQLKAVIGNTKISVRVVDTREPFKDGDAKGSVDPSMDGVYIGRVYNDGVSVFMQENVHKGAVRNFRPSPESVVTNLRVGLGDAVDRFVNSPGLRNRLAGKIGGASRSNGRDGKSPVRSTYMNVNGSTGKLHMVALAGTVAGQSGRDAYVHVRTLNDHSSPHMSFEADGSAEEFLSAAVDSARRNFEGKVNLDYLLAEFEAHGDDPDYQPIFSDDPSIAPVQSAYWEVLHGRSQLYRQDGAGVPDGVFEDMMESLNADDGSEMDMSGEEPVEPDASGLDDDGRVPYEGTPEEAIRAHLADNVDLMFGSFDAEAQPPESGRRFCPSLTAVFMESGYGMARNKDNLIAAMRKLDFTGDELIGSDFESGTMKDKLIKFDAASARSMRELADGDPSSPESAFMRTMYDAIVATLRSTACDIDEADPESILIDANGIVRYKANVLLTSDVNSFLPLEGEIGQIFVPDEDGIVETRYNGSDNKLFTPGYDAYVVPADGENAGKPLVERYRFRGLAQVMVENIQKQIRYDVHNVEESLSPREKRTEPVHAGTTTSINNTYRGLYYTGYKISIEPEPGESLKDTYMRQQTEVMHMPVNVQKAVFATNRGAAHFGKDLIEGSAVAAEYRHQKTEKRMDSFSVHALTNDNVQDPYVLTDRANMAITAENSAQEMPDGTTKGLFDSVLTGSGKNQGAIRYFVVGAGVGMDGRPVFSDSEGARAPIISRLCEEVELPDGTKALVGDMAHIENIPADRQQMALSNYMTALTIAGSSEEADPDSSDGKSHGVGIAQMTLQGLTFDDGAVISKAFAEKYQIVGEDGKLRPIKTGDKICDLSGNKSIVARIIDPEMDMDAAREQGIDKAVQVFRDNPELSIVQSPYGPVSRFNAAGPMMAIDNPYRKPVSLTLPDGSVRDGSIGFMPITITHHTAEDHTRGYDEEAVKQGKGRKISAQQAWMLCAMGATEMMKEIYGKNNKAFVDTREYFNTIGFDLSETGDVRMGYVPHEGENRFRFSLPNDETIRGMDRNFEAQVNEMFVNAVGTKGGFLELPFPLKMPSGETTPLMDPADSSRPDRPMYRFPIMSAQLRSGQEFEDGTRRTHDYTNQYQMIYRKAVEYLRNEKSWLEQGKTGESPSMAAARDSAQQAYDAITDDVIDRKMDAKQGFARSDLMTRRMPNSATAVWTPDPNLKVNQLAVSPAIAKTLGVSDGDRVLVTRDPMLDPAGMRDMAVVVRDDLHGVAVNPLMAMSFKGDFDGDSVGLVAFKTEAALKESYEKFSFEQHMLDMTRVRENGDYALIVNDSMDPISSEFFHPSLYDRRMNLEHAFNLSMRGVPLEQQELTASDGTKYMGWVVDPTGVDTDGLTQQEIEQRLEGVFVPEEITEQNEALTQALSDYAHEAMVDSAGTEVLSYASYEDHMKSLMDIVDHKAKGSMGKLKTYMQYFGLSAEFDEDGRIKTDTIQNIGHPDVTDDDIRAVEQATAIKAHGTGNAGAVQQQIVTFARNIGEIVMGSKNVHEGDRMTVLAAALYVTQAVTQGLLQAKHDPVKAAKYYDMINGPVPDLFRGRALERTATGTWVPMRDQKGKYVQATPEQWVEQFEDLFMSKAGLEMEAVNIEHAKLLAMAATDEDGRIRNMTSKDELAKLGVSPIDMCAYVTPKDHSTVAYLAELAASNRNLFEGTYSQYFAPSQVTENMKHKSLEAEYGRQADELHAEAENARNEAAALRNAVVEAKDNAEDLRYRMENGGMGRDGTNVPAEGFDEYMARLPELVGQAEGAYDMRRNEYMSLSSRVDELERKEAILRNKAIEERESLRAIQPADTRDGPPRIAKGRSAIDLMDGSVARTDEGRAHDADVRDEAKAARERELEAIRERRREARELASIGIVADRRPKQAVAQVGYRPEEHMAANHVTARPASVPTQSQAAPDPAAGQAPRTSHRDGSSIGQSIIEATEGSVPEGASRGDGSGFGE